MKKIFVLISLLSLASLANIAHAQIVGGSNDNAPVVPREKKEATENVNGVLRNRFYLTGSLVKPLGNYGGGVSHNDVVSALQGAEGLGARWGFAGDMGLMLYFHKLPLNENMRLGLDFCLGNFSIQPTYYNTFVKFGGGLGPLATMKVADKIMLDFSFTLCPVFWLQGGSFYLDSEDYGNGIGYSLDSEFNLRKNFNFQIRLNKFLMGLQFDFGRRSGKAERYYSIENPYDYSEESVSSNFSYNFKANALKLRMGFAF
jgi:hypothetical protein